MKIVLIAIVIQALLLPATDKDPAVTAVLSTAVSAEYDDMPACANAVKLLAKSIGDKLLHLEFSCAPKGIGKLEVVPPAPPPATKPRAAPQIIPPGSTSS